MFSNETFGAVMGVIDGVKEDVYSAISSSSAYFRGSFATKAALMAVNWQTSNPSSANYVTNNDYVYVDADETHNGEAWRYSYKYEPQGSGNGWQAQYKINEAPFTQAQVSAITALAALIDAGNNGKYLGVSNGALTAVQLGEWQGGNY